MSDPLPYYARPAHSGLAPVGGASWRDLPNEMRERILGESHNVGAVRRMQRFLLRDSVRIRIGIQDHDDLVGYAFSHLYRALDDLEVNDRTTDDLRNFKRDYITLRSHSIENGVLRMVVDADVIKQETPNGDARHVLYTLSVTGPLDELSIHERTVVRNIVLYCVAVVHRRLRLQFLRP